MTDNEKKQSLVFEFNANQKQAIYVEMVNNQPFFCAKDVCNALGLENPTEALRNLYEDEKLTLGMLRSGQSRRVNFVNESGLYNLIFKSRKHEAKVFRKWVTSEVLPSLRRDGSYITTSIPPLPADSPSMEGNLKKLTKRWVAVLDEEEQRVVGMVKAHLVKGNMTTVAQELGYHRTTVSNVAMGRHRNERILLALGERAGYNKAMGIVGSFPKSRYGDNTLLRVDGMFGNGGAR